MYLCKVKPVQATSPGATGWPRSPLRANVSSWLQQLPSLQGVRQVEEQRQKWAFWPAPGPRQASWQSGVGHQEGMSPHHQLSRAGQVSGGVVPISLLPQEAPQGAARPPVKL